MYVRWDNLNISVDARLLMYVGWENLRRLDDVGWENLNISVDVRCIPMYIYVCIYLIFITTPTVMIPRDRRES